MMSNAIARAPMSASRERIRRTLAAEDAYTLARVKPLERIAGSPIGVAYRALADGVILPRHRITERLGIGPTCRTTS